MGLGFIPGETICHDAKGTMHSANGLGLPMGKVVFDTALAAYNLNPTQSEYPVSKLAINYFGLNVDDGDNPVEPSLSDGKIIYTVPNGKHTFKYLIGTSAVDNSFSTLDTNGTYTATLTLAKHPAP